MSSSTPLLLDLNEMPYVEDEAPVVVEEELHMPFVLDLNQEPRVEHEESVEGLHTQLLDLNEEPHAEDESPMEDRLHTQVLRLNEELDGEEESPMEDRLHMSHEPNSNIDVNGEIANEEPSEAHVQQKHNLSIEERTAIYNMLLKKSVHGKLPNGVTRMVASIFSVSERSIRRIWKRSNYGYQLSPVLHGRMNCGRKRVQIDFNQVKDIPLQQRTTLRSLSCALNISKSTLFRRLKSGDIRRHSNAIKPFLKEENKISRLQFCISMLDASSISHDPTFIGMYNIIHIDEKWFYMTKKSETYYLLADEEDPIRTCKSKSFVGKVMFLVALARPRFDAEGNELFSGKIGVFPLVTKEPAKRTSINRVAGTLETKPITSINKEVIRSYLIGKVIPAIKEKWPQDELKHPIFIQQDNARTHIDPKDAEFCRVATQDGCDIRLMNQPPNSPDLNILDLGFFSAIQSLQYKEAPRTVDELVNAVVKSFEAFSSMKSNRIFLTLQLCMIEIMKTKGSHKYKIPHAKKEMLEREGQLPIVMKCDPMLVQEVLNLLS